MPAGRIIGAIFYICVLFAGVSSIVNLYEAPIAFLQEQFKFKRAAAVGTIGVIGLIVSISIQPWTSQWMDVVSIYICPLGAALAGVMFFWVLSKKSARGSQQRRKEADRFLVLPAWQVRLHSAFPSRLLYLASSTAVSADTQQHDTSYLPLSVSGISCPDPSASLRQGPLSIVEGGFYLSKSWRFFRQDVF